MTDDCRPAPGLPYPIPAMTDDRHPAPGLPSPIPAMTDDRRPAPGLPSPRDTSARQTDARQTSARQVNARQTNARQINARQIGRIGETLARAHLTARGYRIIAANYRSPWGEIDLIAQDGATWVFAEVRTRRTNTYGAPEESVTAAKLTRITQTAQEYLTQHAPEPDAAAIHWRIDLIAIRLGPGRRIQTINHLRNIASE